MDDGDRKKIRDNLGRLVDLVQLEPPSGNVIQMLLNKHIFTEQMISDIMKLPDDSSRKRRLLEDLTRRGPEALSGFVEILLGSGQFAAAKILRPDVVGENAIEQFVDQSVTEHRISEASPPLPLENDGCMWSRPVDGAGDRHNGTVAFLPDDSFMLSVVPSTQMMAGSYIYKMSATPRGWCIIFNIVNFLNDCMPARNGSFQEAAKLKDVFQQLHFDVHVHNDLSSYDLMGKLDDISKSAQLKKHDALVIIVLSHGKKGVVVTQDIVEIEYDRITKKFDNQNCPLLIGKPKMFFFSCCRGETLDHGPKLNNNNPQVDYKAVADSVAIPNVPTISDLLICYSTLDGYVSWRNEDTGSWFGTALARGLMKHAHDTELSHILTRVSNMIGSKQTVGGAKQAMQWNFYGWNKLLYFNPGLPAPMQLAAPEPEN